MQTHTQVRIRMIHTGSILRNRVPAHGWHVHDLKMNNNIVYATKQSYHYHVVKLIAIHSYIITS